MAHRACGKRFAEAVGQHDYFDVFIFDTGKRGTTPLEDAVTALSILEVHLWTTGTHSGGYPVLRFPRHWIDEYVYQISLHGYRAHVLTPGCIRQAEHPRRGGRAEVIEIQTRRIFQ